MRVFFYHTENIRYIWTEWQKGRFPGHLLYGATRLPGHGVDVEAYRHNSKRKLSRALLNISTAWQLFTIRKHVDAVYATHYTGIELIILARAMRIYRRPVVIWQHQPITRPRKTLRDMFSRLFYRGIDGMIFFSETMLGESAATGKFPRGRMYVAHWGADLDFYDRVMRDNPVGGRLGFISTGKERRDFTTLVKAFNATNSPLDIYLTRQNLGVSYEERLREMPVNGNINIHFTVGLIQQKLAALVNKAACVVICCEPANYTVGLTTVVEALALGLPVICTRNSRMPMDVDKERCGVTVAPRATRDWIAAIERIASNPNEAAGMGKRGRALAERLYNDERCASDVALVIRDVVGTRYWQ